MKKRLFLLISLTLALALIATACGSGGGNAASDAGATDSGLTSGGASDAEMTISVMYYDTGVPGGPVHPNTGEPSVLLSKHYPEIFSRTPNVTWEFEALQSATEGYNSYLLRGASGTLPDLSLLDGYWVAAFASQNYTIPMEDVLPADKLDLVYPAFRNMYDGKTHGIVMSTAFNGVLWYRESHLAELGLTMPPQSMEQLADYAKQLTIPGERYGLAMPMAKSEPTTVCLLGYYWGAQQPFVDSNNVAQFNNKTSIDLFNFLKTMYDDKSIPDESLTMSYEDAERMFTTGKASILQHGSWLTGWDVRTPDFADDIMVSPLPAPAGGISSQNAGGWGLSVTTKDTAKYPAIAEFISVIILEPEFVKLRLTECGELPVSSNFSPEDVDWIPEKYAKTIMDMLPDANTRPIVEVYPDASLEYCQAMQEVVMNVKDAETALDDAVDRVAETARESGWGQ